MIKSLLIVLLLAIVAQASWEVPMDMDVDMYPLVASEDLLSDSLSSMSLSFGYNYPGHYIFGQPEDTPGAPIPQFFAGIFEEDTTVSRVYYKVGAKLELDDLLIIGQRVRDGQMVPALAPSAGQLLMLNVTEGQVIRANTIAFLMKLDRKKNARGDKPEGNQHGEETLAQSRLDGK